MSCDQTVLIFFYYLQTCQNPVRSNFTRPKYVYCNKIIPFAQVENRFAQVRRPQATAATFISLALHQCYCIAVHVLFCRVVVFGNVCIIKVFYAHKSIPRDRRFSYILCLFQKSCGGSKWYVSRTSLVCGQKVNQRHFGNRN